MGSSKIFWNASLAEMKKGYVDDPPSGEYICLICGERFAKGRIYQIDGVLWEAEKALQTHITRKHSSTFEFLLEMDKKYTGLTDHQKNLLLCFYQGFSDKEIAAKMENGNTSTIRNQRFSFREKAKQAKVFLAIMELLEEHGPKEEKAPEVPGEPIVVDQRFVITPQENEEILKAYFKEGVDGPLSNFPKKEKRKLIILRQLIQRFDPQRKYTEKETNEVLKQAVDDYVTVRRSLIKYGFMDRYPDGSCYWVKTEPKPVKS
jgi:hypothetical protein